MAITLGTETLLGKVVKIYYGKCYVIHGKYSDIFLSREEVEKILLKNTCKKWYKCYNNTCKWVKEINHLRKNNNLIGGP